MKKHLQQRRIGMVAFAVAFLMALQVLLSPLAMAASAGSSPLDAFGNRIPSLTFEVEADDAAVDGGFVGDVLLGEAGRCVGNWPIAGYAASGERAREALAPLFAVDGVRLASGPAGWRLAPASASEPSALSDFTEMRRPFRDADRVEHDGCGLVVGRRNAGVLLNCAASRGPQGRPFFH